ncbi:MAG: hypothetical protein PVSMB10_15190 [Pseudarthrobacter sp.]
MLVDHLVLGFGDTKGSVPVGNPREDCLGECSGVVDKVGGESGDAAGQGLLLVAVAPVRTAEQAVKQFGVGGKQAGIKLGGDFTDA